MALNTAKYEVVLNTLTAMFRNAAAAVEVFYPQVCYVHPSQRLTETYGMLGNMPGIREWRGDRKFKELRAMDFSISNKLWESSLLIPKVSVDDDHMGLYGPVMSDLAAEAIAHPDELLFNTMIANGTTSLIWDGQYFFDTDHAWGNSGSQSNKLTPACVSNTAVTALEFRAAFEAARVKLLGYKNDQGKLFNRSVISKLSDLMVLVPPELELAARTAFNATILSNNTVVTIDVPRIVSSAMLTDATSFYLFNLKSAMKPFIFQAREPLHPQTSGANDIETKDLKFMTQARYNFGYFAWWNCIKNTMTNS